MGRHLRVLRIDDVHTILSTETTDYSPEDGDGAVGTPLRLLTFVTEGKVCLRIGGLASAVQFWSAFRNDMTPDIVIADIDFEHDNSGPLKTWRQEAPHIPSGLSHIKPFAAIARASGSPIAIAMYTGDQERWNLLARKQNGSSYSTPPSSLLAAHDDRTGSDSRRRDHLLPCKDLAPVWNGSERTATDVKFAIARRPATIVVKLSNDYVERRVILWRCERRSERGRNCEHGARRCRRTLFPSSLPEATLAFRFCFLMAESMRSAWPRLLGCR
jgi:hypothetical protein